MSDASSNPSSLSRLPPGAGDLEAPGEARWRELVAQIGVEIAGPLTVALERVHALTRTGRIDRAGLRALRDEVERARASGMIGQQLARFASGRLRQSHERLHLAQLLKTVLAQRAGEAQVRGVQLKQVLKPVEVIVDPALLASLLNTLLDWALAQAQSNIEFRIDMKPWPAHARLTARFAHQSRDKFDEAANGSADDSRLDSLAWRLLQQTVWTMGLHIERRDQSGVTSLTIEFPRTVSEVIEGIGAIEFDQVAAPSVSTKPLAGNHVLVLSARRDVRTQVHDAIHHMGLIVDFVGSVQEAAEFCRDGLPHAIVFEAALRDERFERLRDDIDTEAPEFVFVEVTEEGNLFEISGFSGSGMARIGRDAITSALPSALMFELSKGL